MRDPAELIRAWCREDDQGAFRDFYRAQAPRLWKYLIARGCDSQSAYDLLAETFERFLRKVCHDPRAPVAFLYRIAVNLHIDRHRRVKASPVDARADWETASQVAADDPPDDHEQLRAMVLRLPEREQNLLLLRYWIGLSHEEAAQALGLPGGTVRRQCAELLEKLRKGWEQ
jgi:RNA polymerase sigma-70 factor (ECF subfamily)